MAVRPHIEALVRKALQARASGSKGVWDASMAVVDVREVKGKHYDAYLKSLVKQYNAKGTDIRMKWKLAEQIEALQFIARDKVGKGKTALEVGGAYALLGDDAARTLYGLIRELEKGTFDNQEILSQFINSIEAQLPGIEHSQHRQELVLAFESAKIFALMNHVQNTNLDAIAAYAQYNQQIQDAELKLYQLLKENPDNPSVRKCAAKMAKFRTVFDNLVDLQTAKENTEWLFQQQADGTHVPTPNVSVEHRKQALDNLVVIAKRSGNADTRRYIANAVHVNLSTHAKAIWNDHTAVERLGILLQEYQATIEALRASFLSAHTQQEQVKLGQSLAEVKHSLRALRLQAANEQLANYKQQAMSNTDHLSGINGLLGMHEFIEFDSAQDKEDVQKQIRKELLDVVANFPHRQDTPENFNNRVLMVMEEANRIMPILAQQDKNEFAKAFEQVLQSVPSDMTPEERLESIKAFEHVINNAKDPVTRNLALNALNEFVLRAVPAPTLQGQELADFVGNRANEFDSVNKIVTAYIEQNPHDLSAQKIKDSTADYAFKLRYASNISELSQGPQGDTPSATWDKFIADNVETSKGFRESFKQMGEMTTKERELTSGDTFLSSSYLKPEEIELSLEILRAQLEKEKNPKEIEKVQSLINLLKIQHTLYVVSEELATLLESKQGNVYKLNDPEVQRCLEMYFKVSGQYSLAYHQAHNLDALNGKAIKMCAAAIHASKGFGPNERFEYIDPLGNQKSEIFDFKRMNEKLAVGNQRMLKYPLYLKALVNAEPSDSSPEYSALNRALRHTVQLAAGANQVVRNYANAKELEDSKNKIEGMLKKVESKGFIGRLFSSKDEAALVTAYTIARANLLDPNTSGFERKLHQQVVDQLEKNAFFMQKVFPKYKSKIDWESSKLRFVSDDMKNNVLLKEVTAHERKQRGDLDPSIAEFSKDKPTPESAENQPSVQVAAKTRGQAITGQRENAKQEPIAMDVKFMTAVGHLTQHALATKNAPDDQKVTFAVNKENTVCTFKVGKDEYTFKATADDTIELLPNTIEMQAQAEAVRKQFEDLLGNPPSIERPKPTAPTSSNG